MWNKWKTLFRHIITSIDFQDLEYHRQLWIPRSWLAPSSPGYKAESDELSPEDRM